MLKKKGILVKSITEQFDDTSSGRLMEAIVETFDEYYSDNLGEEVTRGMRESASRGFYLSDKPPFGYIKTKIKDGEKVRTKLDLNPSQVEIVHEIFNDVLNGKGLIEIVKDLNNRGIFGPNNKGWNKTTIHSILNNEIYTGTLVWGKNSKRGLDPVRVENAHPTIISYEIFNQVHNLMKDRAPSHIHPRRTSSRFLLSGITRCGYCGKALTGRDAKSGKFSYYVCGTLDKKGSYSCLSNYLNSKKFEDPVIDKIKERILTEDNLIQLVNIVNEQMDSASYEYQNELKLLTKENDNLSFRLNKLYDAVESGNISLTDLTPRIRDLRNRQEKLLARQAELEALLSDRKIKLADTRIVKEYINELRDILNEGELCERKAFIRSFVKEIIVMNNEVQLIYDIPLSQDGLTEEKVGVLPIVHSGGRYWI